MFKSIFSKYFAVISAVVIVSFLALGSVQTVMASNYWLEEKQAGLSQSAAYIAQVTADSMSANAFTGNYYLNRERTNALLQAMTALGRCDILLTDRSGTVLLGSFQDAAGIRPGQRLSGDVMEKLAALQGGDVFLEGTLSNAFTSRRYTLGRAVEKDGTPVGYVLVASKTAELQHYLGDNIQIFLLAALGVLLVAFAVSYLLTYRMVQPLREMAAAARSFGDGDFSRRIRVRGKDEVAALAESLNNMATSLAAEEDVRRSFVANVSHELKTPMTSIAGFIDGILDGTVPAEKREHYLGIVAAEVRRLSRLVKAMLDLSRIDSGQLTLSPVEFDLTESVGHALLSFQQPIEEKELRIEGLEDCPPVPAVGDYALIGQVVYNLVENAVKFTPQGGEIRFAFRQEPEWVTVSIRNTGVGIPPEELPHLFERFYKSDKSRSRDKTGLGLGLYLVHSILALHGGDIRVRSVQGEFCEFEFRLPVTTTDKTQKGVL